MWANAAKDIAGTLLLAALASVLAASLPFPWAFIGFYLFFMAGCGIYFKWQKFVFAKLKPIDRFFVLSVLSAFICTLVIHYILLALAKIWDFPYPATSPLFDRLWDETPLIFLLFSVIIGPVFEELWFRGVILQRLARGGFWPTAVMTQVLFGLVHYPFVVPAILLSMPLFILAWRRRLYEAICVHVLWNSWYLLVAMGGLS